MIDISSYSKAEVLAALYNSSKPLGLGWLHFDPTPMSVEEAENVLSRCGDYLYFDYLEGRVMKVNLSKDTFDPWLYDRDNGKGAAQAAIDGIKGK